MFFPKVVIQPYNYLDQINIYICSGINQIPPSSSTAMLHIVSESTYLEKPTTPRPGLFLQYLVPGAGIMGLGNERPASAQWYFPV